MGFPEYFDYILVYSGVPVPPNIQIVGHGCYQQLLCIDENSTPVIKSLYVFMITVFPKTLGPRGLCPQKFQLTHVGAGPLWK